MISKCNCQQCGQPIEFEAEHSGAVVDCPHCGQNTLIETPRREAYSSPPKLKNKFIEKAPLWCGIAFVVIAITASVKWMPDTVFPFMFILMGLFLYFSPSILGRKKRNSSAIFVLNLFLGWTFIGWVVALVWAATKDPEK